MYITCVGMMHCRCLVRENYFFYILETEWLSPIFYLKKCVCRRLNNGIKYVHILSSGVCEYVTFNG